MPEIAIVDTSALLSSIDRDDRFHAASTAVFRRRDLSFVLSSPVVAEIAYLVSERFGSDAESGFVRRLRSWTIETPLADEWHRDFPLGSTDASIILLAERFQTDLVVTLDRRHFAAVRPSRVNALGLLPD